MKRLVIPGEVEAKRELTGAGSVDVLGGDGRGDTGVLRGGRGADLDGHHLAVVEEP
jgi:RecB family endonuclease NucS